MGSRGPKKDAGSRQLPVRFTGEDAQHLDALQQRLDQDAATIVRWALRFFYRAAEAHEWNVSSRGEPLTISSSGKEEDSLQRAPRKAASSP